VILLEVKLGLGLLPTTLGNGRIPPNDEREEVKAVDPRLHSRYTCLVHSGGLN
jgi:hypothetical protein